MFIHQTEQFLVKATKVLSRKLAGEQDLPMKRKTVGGFQFRAESILNAAGFLLPGQQAKQHREREDLEHCERMRRETMELCMQTMIQHLEEFIRKNPKACYEEWIEALHPENSRNNKIDRRFYLQESHHRKLWSQSHGETAMKSALV